jgi:hypothetical protein
MGFKLVTVTRDRKGKIFRRPHEEMHATKQSALKQAANYGRIDKSLGRRKVFYDVIEVKNNPAKRRARRKNPKARAVVLYARRPGGTLLKWTGRKFATSGRAVQFANRASAAAVAGMLRLQFPVLKRYRLIIA